MRTALNARILRRILILCILTVGLVFVSYNARLVSAKTCYDANNDFYGALSAFDTAFDLYYYNNPTSCNQECEDDPDPIACENRCRQTRRTDLSNRQSGILQAGSELDSCSNPEPDRCGNARARRDFYVATYNYPSYADPNERLDIYAAYSACMDGSGIEQCE